MSWIKVFSINIFVLLGFLLVLEAAIRSVDIVKTCRKGSCDFSKFNVFEADKGFSSKYIGISRFDNLLGYVPKENFNQVINAAGWTGKSVTITEEGFRANKKIVPRKNDAVLVVGDSFTFGDQVSNGETWASCLQDRLGKRVDNAGVFGYGAGQAVLRASYLQDRFNYDTVVLSVLVGSDFERDRMSYRDGFPKPYIIYDKGNVSWSKVSDPKMKGTKINPNYNLVYYISKYSRLYRYLSSRVVILPIDYSSSINKVGESAATVVQLIPWLIKEFSKLEIDHKIVLLQYSSNSLSTYVIWEREFIKDQLKKYNSIVVVDTAERLITENSSKVWQGHHTKYGNQVVCEELYMNAFKRGKQ